jgi:RNA 2',3'-cyclic 3'-phosphodiesterase
MGEMQAWRCFVAVPIGERLRRELAAAVAGWRTAVLPDRLRWTEPDAWHLTLAFLGATEPERVPQIAAQLEHVLTEHAAFEVATGGLGAFPSSRAARVVWYGIDDRERRLARLANHVRRAVGVAGDSRFRAHLTLARAREPLAIGSRLVSMSVPDGLISVDRAVLYRSHLGRGPARYEALASLPLGASNSSVGRETNA